VKEHLQQLLSRAVATTLPDLDTSAAPHVERTRDATHGDFASNVAMILAKPAHRPPRKLAEAIVAALPESDRVARVEIAGPGFINFFLKPAALQTVVPAILDAGIAYGTGTAGGGEKVLVEFVSANPTGPLHVGHGRGAAYGDCVARLLAAAGFDVHREYYVNDAGRQMDILILSLWLRYLEATGEDLDYPANAYRGDYVTVAAERLWGEHGERFKHPAAAVFKGAPPDAPKGGDKDAHIDALIDRARELLGANDFRELLDFILAEQLADIEDDLDEFRVRYDRWFSERGLVDAGAVAAAIEQLREGGHVYEAEGATWFAASRFGDEKDRVLVRGNGDHTYFAADVAYHLDKLGRGHHTLVDVWGADHHGYVPRVTAAVRAIAGAEDRLVVRLVQFANLYHGSERLPMSTRAGEYVTLRELRREVGVDAARYFYVMRSNDQHLDFDLELAKSQSNDNPVYYIQYAHARVCSVDMQLTERGWRFEREAAELARLETDHEQRLLTALSRYPETVEAAALGYSPHTLAHYLRDLADVFHSYYNAHTFLVDEAPLRNARLALVYATRQVLANGLDLLGVSAPKSM
jgi:arginyl-tRNA synthetase